MIKQLSVLSHHRLMWAGLIFFGALLEAVALYYQYFLDEAPCVLCIHVRMWVAAIMLVGVLGLLASVIFPKKVRVKLNRVWHVLSVIAGAGFLERSYRVLAVERGWTLDSCGMGLGLPDWLSWLKVDVWFPWLFEAQGICGYTPEVLGLTMAEALVIVASGWIVVCILLMFFSWRLPR